MTIVILQRQSIVVAGPLWIVTYSGISVIVSVVVPVYHPIAARQHRRNVSTNRRSPLSTVVNSVERLSLPEEEHPPCRYRVSRYYHSNEDCKGYAESSRVFLVHVKETCTNAKHVVAVVSRRDWLRAFHDGIVEMCRANARGGKREEED